MSSLKLYARYGSTELPGWAAGRATACVTSASHVLRVRADRGLAQLEDHELGRLDRRDPDDRDHLARVADLRRVGLLVALDEERLLRGGAEQRAVAPHPGQERADVPPDRPPQQLVVGLEDDPPGTVPDGLLEHREQAAHVEVAPFARLGGQGPGAPDAD